MKISLVTPAGKRSRSGNRATAVRWAGILRDLGHRVDVAESWDGQPADMMVAVHAWRSADSIAAFAERHPERPLVVLLAGTDIYRFQAEAPEVTHRSMQLADRLVTLHDLAADDIPARFRDKVAVIHQSARPLPQPRKPAVRHFDVAVIGHLREEKDPLRAPQAARLLPAGSRVRVLHLGKAHSPDWAEAARAEMKTNPRYRWLGELPAWQVRKRLAGINLMVLSSIMEGGANVVSEAVVAGVPVVASDIAGAVGLLGPDHPGYFPVGDTQALAERLHRAETDPAYLAALRAAGDERATLFTPEREHRAWQRLLHDLW